MEKNSTLNKKLKSYSALAGTLIAAGSSADAQIVYTDVLPDAVVATGGSYNLDVDNDGTADFALGVVHQTYLYGGTFPIQYDFTVIAPVDPLNAVDTIAGGNTAAHNIGDMINGSLLWEDGAAASYQLMALAFAPPFSAYNTGNFLGQTDKYIGLRFKIAGADHYGWARVDVNSTSTILTVKSYAYDATPGTGITAGMTSTAINGNTELANNVNVFSYGKDVHVNLNNNIANTGTILVTDVLGKEVVNVEISGAENLISLADASNGIYFVTVSQNGNRMTEKVTIR
jgi:hypothetical protein